MQKIILAGADSPQKQNFKHELERQCTEYSGVAEELKQQCGGSITISEDLNEAGAEDLVFLFAQADQMESFDHLLEQLFLLARKRPASTVLLSDSRVYGKIFGAPGARSEHELGYVCHTSAEDTAAANLRTAENLAYRLAGEGMQICIARMENVALDAQKSDDDAGRSGKDQISDGGSGGKNMKNCGSEAYASAVHAALRVLLYGTPGEVYNLPGTITTSVRNSHPDTITASGTQDSCPGTKTVSGAQTASHSPLSPEPVYLDTSAVEAL
jgi:hypothetical protein